MASYLSEKWREKARRLVKFIALATFRTKGESLPASPLTPPGTHRVLRIWFFFAHLRILHDQRIPSLNKIN